MRVPVTSVTLSQMPSGLKFQYPSIAGADAHVLENPQIRFEFEVEWADGTAQKGRVTGKPISVWLADWCRWALAPPSELSEPARAAQRSLSPSLINHAKLLRDKLTIS